MAGTELPLANAYMVHVTTTARSAAKIENIFSLTVKENVNWEKGAGAVRGCLIQLSVISMGLWTTETKKKEESCVCV